MNSRLTRSVPLRLSFVGSSALGAALLALAFTAAPMSPGAMAAETALMRDGIPTLAPLVHKVTAAVVNVSVKSKVTMAENPMMNDPFFRRFFDMPEGQPQPRERERMSAGSGVIINAARGYIVTNHHVVDSATEISVRLKDGREFTAKLVGSDEGTDIALLQIEAKNLTEIPVGDSNELQVGDYVVAIGNPFELSQTVSAGIVSALGRSNLQIEDYEDFIQTDAAINPGNSGGALINLKGQLIGINTAILGPSGGNVGIGFAIPSNMMTGITKQLADHGEVRRGRIGVVIQPMNPGLADSLGISETEGALISRVDKDSPAEQAGLKAGDVVVALDGKPVRNSGDLRNRIGMMTIGTSVDLTVLRDGKRQQIKVTIGKAPTQTLASVESRPALQGASFANPESGDDAEGVVVKDVQARSPAWQLGLRAGDVIVAVNRKPVADVDEFTSAMASSGRQMALFIKRGEDDVLLVVP